MKMNKMATYQLLQLQYLKALFCRTHSTDYPSLIRLWNEFTCPAETVTLFNANNLCRFFFSFQCSLIAGKNVAAIAVLVR